MNRSLFAVLAVLVLFGIPASAQRNVAPVIDRDPLLEADAKHNLDVAWQAFRPARQAYKQVLSRFEETFAAYPTFSKIDEFLYLAGMSSWYLSENKGKQRVDLRLEREREKYAPEKLRDDAKMYLTLLVEKFPDSKYRDEAEKTLSVLNKEPSK
jgi:outer membrane protein assembly factor BamD (BamD/ComL family)